MSEPAETSRPMHTPVYVDQPYDQLGYTPHTTVERALINHATAVLSRVGEGVTSLCFKPRTQSDVSGRPLPYLVARGRTDLSEAEVRAAIPNEVVVHVAVVTVAEGVVELGFSPSPAFCERFVQAELPAFEVHEHERFRGTREIAFDLAKAIDEEQLRGLAERCRASTAAFEVDAPHRNRIIFKVPALHEGAGGTDPAFNDRVRWLATALAEHAIEGVETEGAIEPLR